MSRLTTVLVTGVALAAAIIPGSDSRPGSGAAPDLEDAQKLIFFGVLERLFVEGAESKDVDRILTVEPGTTRYAHFVYGCPVCMPVIDALRVYRARPLFYGRKGDSDTFGPGWDAAMKERLWSQDLEVRLGAIHDFVQRAIDARLDSQRPTPGEREHTRLVLEELKAKGLELLRASQAAGQAGAMAGASTCAACAGAADGAR